MISTASDDGIAFLAVTTNDVILAVTHFKSQAREEDGIPQSVITETFSFIRSYLSNLFNASLIKGIFSSSWKKALILDF